MNGAGKKLIMASYSIKVHTLSCRELTIKGKQQRNLLGSCCFRLYTNISFHPVHCTVYCIYKYYIYIYFFSDFVCTVSFLQTLNSVFLSFLRTCYFFCIMFFCCFLSFHLVHQSISAFSLKNTYLFI